MYDRILNYFYGREKISAVRHFKEYGVSVIEPTIFEERIKSNAKFSMFMAGVALVFILYSFIKYFWR